MKSKLTTMNSNITILFLSSTPFLYSIPAPSPLTPRYPRYLVHLPKMSTGKSSSQKKLQPISHKKLQPISFYPAIGLAVN